MKKFTYLVLISSTIISAIFYWLYTNRVDVRLEITKKYSERHVEIKLTNHGRDMFFLTQGTYYGMESFVDGEWLEVQSFSSCFSPVKIQLSKDYPYTTVKNFLGKGTKWRAKFYLNEEVNFESFPMKYLSKIFKIESRPITIYSPEFTLKKECNQGYDTVLMSTQSIKTGEVSNKLIIVD